MQKSKRLWYLYGILPGVVPGCEWRGTNTFYLVIITSDNCRLSMVIIYIRTILNCLELTNTIRKTFATRL